MATKMAEPGRTEIFRSSPRMSGANGGFTLVEVMIVVAIVAILCAVAFPVYIGHIQRARVVTYIYPGLHTIETNISLYYATRLTLPTPDELPALAVAANTQHFLVEMLADRLKVTVNSPEKLGSLNGMVMYAKPRTDNSRIILWTVSGTLAERLGIKE